MTIRAPSSQIRQGLLAATAVAALVLACQPAAAQKAGAKGTVAAAAAKDSAGKDAKGKKPDKLFVEANELVYEKDTDKVSAVGNAQLYYQGRTLEADRVIYDRKSKRVFAEGNARITEANGTKFYGDRFELTDDFKQGFIDSLRSESPDRQRFSAARGERIDGETTVLERGTYTACEPCRDNPSRPPLWQVRAARITHKSSEHTIYYEQASLEFFGMPVVYIPFFSTPDPTVTRKSGFLPPSVLHKTSLGYGVSTPYFWAIAPNIDLTLTPTFLTRQGVLGQAEWRHRLENGSYSLRAAGIFQQTPAAFLPDPIGAGNRKFRGALETTGRFFINEKWTIGWDIAASSDKFFYSNYRLKTDSLSDLFRRESVSTIYLAGQGERSWFDLRGYYFRPLTTTDWQKQQAAVHPVLDYDRRFTAPGIGGELQLTANLTSVSRQAAAFESLPDGTLAGSIIPALLTGVTRPDSKGRTYNYALYEGCYQYVPGRCLLRGMAGNYTRATLALSWRRSYIDPIGQVWTPFASFRMDAAFTNLNQTYNAAAPTNMAVYGNDKQRFYLPEESTYTGRAMPMAGIEYRYPFVGRFGASTHQVEPIAQIVFRPNEAKIGNLPNEDAHSLVFDDTVLFSPNKFSGFDRVEGGVRANYGLQYSITGDRGGHASLLFGQSLQVAGRNSYAKADIINTGLDSGLESRRSDYVGRISVSPFSALSFTARGRFDERTFALRRIEMGANASFGALGLSSVYARIGAQPNIGYQFRREGWLNTAKLQLPNNWYVSGSLLLDMDRYLRERANHLADPVTYPTYNNSPFRVAATSLAIGYQDECTDFALQWSRSTNDVVTGDKKSGSLFLMRLELKHLGQSQYRSSTGNYTSTAVSNGL